MLDLGVPEGAVVSFAYRPHRMVRGNVGLGYNGVSPGVRIGATFLPLGWGPSLNVAYGHYFEGDANKLAQSLGGNPDDETALLSRVGYDYVNFRAGMEFGGERLIFFSRVGVSYVRTTIHEFDSLLTPEDEDGTGSQSTTRVEVTSDPILSAWVPSIQLVMIVRL